MGAHELGHLPAEGRAFLVGAAEVEARPHPGVVDLPEGVLEVPVGAGLPPVTRLSSVKLTGPDPSTLWAAAATAASSEAAAGNLGCHGIGPEASLHGHGRVVDRRVSDAHQHSTAPSPGNLLATTTIEFCAIRVQSTTARGDPFILAAGRFPARPVVAAAADGTSIAAARATRNRDLTARMAASRARASLDLDMVASSRSMAR